jgi:hypothetical protein
MWHLFLNWWQRVTMHRVLLLGLALEQIRFDLLAGNTVAG